MEFNKKIFIDGVSGMGKTTFIENNSGKSLDYFAMCQKYPVLGNKASFCSPNIIYTLLFLEEAGLLTHSNNFELFDRSPFTNIIYDQVLRLLSQNRKTVNQIIDWLDREPIPPTFWDFANKFHVIVLVPYNEEEENNTLSRMIQRQNGKDILNLEYVNLQTIVFRYWAHRAGWITLGKKEDETMDKWFNKIEDTINNKYKIYEHNI